MPSPGVPVRAPHTAERPDSPRSAGTEARLEGSLAPPPAVEPPPFPFVASIAFTTDAPSGPRASSASRWACVRGGPAVPPSPVGPLPLPEPVELPPEGSVGRSPLGLGTASTYSSMPEFPGGAFPLLAKLNGGVAAAIKPMARITSREVLERFRMFSCTAGRLEP